MNGMHGEMWMAVRWREWQRRRVAMAMMIYEDL